VECEVNVSGLPVHLGAFVLPASLALCRGAAAQAPAAGYLSPGYGFFGAPYYPSVTEPPFLPFGSWVVTHSGLNTYYQFQPYRSYDTTTVGTTTYAHLNPYGAWLLQQQAAARAALQRAYRQGWVDAQQPGRPPADGEESEMRFPR
jgi:hypothetical protein